MKNLLRITIILVGSLLFSTFNKVNANVRFDNPVFDVEVKIEKDSTFTVKEKIIYKAYGDFHGLRRDIPLEDPDLKKFCQNSPGKTCGGFDKLIPLAVYDSNGSVFNTNQYKTYELVNESDGKRYFRFEKEFYSNGREVNGEEFGWTIEYKILGGIQWIQESPYFYWNLLPFDRSGPTKNSKLTIEFPDSTELNSNSFTFFDNFKNQTFKISNISAVITLQDIPSLANFTLSYRFNKNELIKPSTLVYKITAPEIGNSVLLDGVIIEESNSGTLNYIPSGEREIRVEHFGYMPSINVIEFKPGETSFLEVGLQPQPWMIVVLFFNTLIFLSGIVLIPAGIFLVYFVYNRKGKDKNRIKTIIPLFSPPEGVHPYLLGSLKDERVDKVDLIGTIIDLAYRGYIKIKELEKEKNYLLTRLSGNEKDEGLNESEKLILDSLFGGVTEIETRNLHTRFPSKYLAIQKRVYSELTEKGYFTESPEQTRSKYLSIGIGLMIIGALFSILSGLFLSSPIGYPFIASPGIAIFVIGLGFTIIHRFMPSKTTLGSKTLNEILGFKMYLNTAERYRLQKLGPDEFERYLSYAIVFGIEKEWAKKFKDIYNQVPEWYEGSATDGIWNAIFVSSLIRNFSDSTITNITPISSNGSASGGGWSGGGGFGGFSGGGGGGGSSGGW